MSFTTRPNILIVVIIRGEPRPDRSPFNFICKRSTSRIEPFPIKIEGTDESKSMDRIDTELYNRPRFYERSKLRRKLVIYVISSFKFDLRVIIIDRKFFVRLTFPSCSLDRFRETNGMYASGCVGPETEETTRAPNLIHISHYLMG